MTSYIHSHTKTHIICMCYSSHPVMNLKPFSLNDLVPKRKAMSALHGLFPQISRCIIKGFSITNVFVIHCLLMFQLLCKRLVHFVLSKKPLTRNWKLFFCYLHDEKMVMITSCQISLGLLWVVLENDSALSCSTNVLWTNFSQLSISMGVGRKWLNISFGWTVLLSLTVICPEKGDVI